MFQSYLGKVLVVKSSRSVIDLWPSVWPQAWLSQALPAPSFAKQGWPFIIIT